MAGEFKHSSKHSGANFESRKLRWAEFSYSVIASARLRGADLRDADTRYSVASDADFTDADLRRAKLSYSVLSGARFDGARLEGANLNYSVITRSTRFSSKTTYDATTRFPRGFDPQKAGLTFVESGKEADSEKSAASRAASKVSREPPQRTFKAVLHPTASGLPNAGRYGDFTLSGPVTESFVALPAPVGEVLCDPSGRHVIGMGGHDLYRLDLKNQTATRLIARDVPEISWAMGIAYDTKRDRLLLATLGGEGFLYSYKPDDDAWSLIASLENVDLTAIAYYEPLDRIFGIAQDHNTGNAELYEFEGANGAFLRSRLLDMPIVGSFIDRALQLLAVDHHLVFVQVPESEQEADPVIHVIDPRTAIAKRTVDPKLRDSTK